MAKNKRSTVGSGDSITKYRAAEGQLAKRQEVGPRSDLTHRLIENMNLSNADLSHSMFTGSILRQCKFANVNFYRCDFDAMRIEKCTFNDCNMSGDFRSSAIASSRFNNCLMDKSFINDCTFDRTYLDNCQLSDSAISQNTFQSCTLEHCSFKMSSYIHNTCLSSRFARTFMGDCTLLYTIMKDCAFEECVMNLESIGTIYGLTELDLMSFSYMYRGELQEIPSKLTFVPMMLAEYERRHWKLGSAVFQINMGLMSVLGATRDYFDSLRSDVMEGALVNREELYFVAKLFGELLREGRLPLASCILGLDVSKELIGLLGKAKSAESERSYSALVEFSSRLTLILQQSMEFLASFLPQSIIRTDKDLAAELTLTFNERPMVNLSSLLIEVVQASGMEVAGPTSTRHSYEGSYTEVLQTTVQTVLAFQLLLYLTNGCLIQLTEIKARFRVLREKRLSKDYTEIAMRPRQVLPLHLVNPIRAIASKALSFDWASDPHLGGLERKNIVRAELRKATRKASKDHQGQRPASRTRTPREVQKS